MSLVACMCVCTCVWRCMYVCCGCCVNKYVAPHLGEASPVPACALFANTNPAPLEGHAHASKSSQGTHLRTGRLHSRLPGSVVVGPTPTDPAGIRRCARDVRTWSAAKNHTDEERGGLRDPGVRQPGAGRGQMPARSKSAFHGRPTMESNYYKVDDIWSTIFCLHVFNSL